MADFTLGKMHKYINIDCTKKNITDIVYFSKLFFNLLTYTF